MLQNYAHFNSPTFSKATLTSDVGSNCDPSSENGDYRKNKGSIVSLEEVQVLNGDLIQVVFTCTGLNSGDVYEGEAKFEVVDSRTGFITTSKGRIFSSQLSKSLSLRFSNSLLR